MQYPTIRYIKWKSCSITWWYNICFLLYFSLFSILGVVFSNTKRACHPLHKPPLCWRRTPCCCPNQHNSTRYRTTPATPSYNNSNKPTCCTTSYTTLATTTTVECWEICVVATVLGCRLRWQYWLQVSAFILCFYFHVACSNHDICLQAILTHLTSGLRTP